MTAKIRDALPPFRSLLAELTLQLLVPERWGGRVRSPDARGSHDEVGFLSTSAICKAYRAWTIAYIARSALSYEAFTCNIRSPQSRSLKSKQAKGSAAHSEVQ